MAQGTWRVDDKENEELQRDHKDKNKIGYNQAQAVRDKLNQIVSNPVVNAGLQIGHTALQRGGGFTFQKLPFINKSPMDMLGEASNQLITKPLSDLTNVDSLWVDTLLAAAPFGKAGVSKLLKGLKVGKGLKTVNQFTLPTSKRTPTTNLSADLKELVNLKELADGSYGLGAGLAINPKHLDFAAKQMLGDAQQVVKHIPVAALSKLNSNTSTKVTKQDPLIYLDPKYKSIDIGFENTTANQTFFQKRADLLKSTKLQDQKYGIISTPPNSIDSSPLIYSQAGFSRFWQHLHHLDPKAESSAFLTVAEEIGGERGLLNAYAFMRNRGVGGGNKASDILFMNDWPHHMLHQFRIEQGLQPSKPDWLLNSGKKLNLTDELRVKVDGDLNNLMKLLDGWVEDNWKPSRAKAFQYQREYVRKWNSILDDPGKGVWDQKDLGPRSLKSMREQPTNVQKLYEDIPEWYSDQSLQLPPGSDESIKAIMRQMGLPLEDINWLYKEINP